MLGINNVYQNIKKKSWINIISVNNLKIFFKNSMKKGNTWINERFLSEILLVSI